MKMRRILSILLVAVTLLGVCALSAGCKKTDGIVALKGNPVAVDVSEYTLVYGNPIHTETFTATYNALITAFADRIAAVTGEKYSAYSITRTRTTAADPEILVGNTGRTESSEALASIKGDGFAIAVTENKIVIVGTTNLLTMMAVNYFMDNYLAVGEEPTSEIKVHKSAKADNVEQLTIARSSRADDGNLDEAVAEDYTYIHSDKLGKLAPAYAGTDSNLAGSKYTEFEQVATTEMVEQVKALTGIGGKFFPIKTDKAVFDKEIQIGRVDRAENRALLNEIAADEYVVDFQGDKILVTGWSEATVRSAVIAYEDVVREGTVKDADGVTSVIVPKGLRLTGVVNENWVLDFPKPEGLQLHNAMDANHDHYQFLYLGEGVDATAYKSYVQQLKAAGYKDYMPENEIEGSYFSTLVNEQEGKMLYVSFNAYAHQEDYDEFDWVATKTLTKDKGVYEYDPALRIVSAPLSNANMAGEELLKASTYNKVTNSMVTTMPLGSGAVGLNYIITLEDGRFIIFDGGNVSTEGAEYDRLWNTLTALNERIYGKNNNKPVHIAAWVLTHGHGDHFRVFNQFLKKYGQTGNLKMDYMIGNVMGPDSMYPCRSITNEFTTAYIAEMQKNVKGGFKYLKAHTGQRYYFANCEVEVLMTWEDHNPLIPNNSNETNTVLRFSMTNKDAPTLPANVQIWTGDANRWQSRYLCAMYGDYLKADMVSIAHHGNNGCEIDFYEMVDPTCVWWPHNAASVKSYLNETKKNSDFRHQVDQYVCRELASVQYVFASGANNASTNDSYYTTVELTVDGADYEGVFDVMTGEKLAKYFTSVYAPSALMKR